MTHRSDAHVVYAVSRQYDPSGYSIARGFSISQDNPAIRAVCHTFEAATAARRLLATDKRPSETPDV